MPLISAKEVTKLYGTKKNPIKALGPITLEIEPKSFTVVLGRSGSGKSTMLNIFSGLDKLTGGELKINDKNLSKASSKDLAAYRSKIGIIFQSYNLLPNLNTVENVMMGGWAGGQQTTQDEASEILKSLGMSHRLKANIKTLSGGEKQRVAIARSLIGNPEVLFCDEPTGALDSKNEEQVKDILVNLHKDKHITIFMVTHNPEFANIADQVIEMQDGEIKEIKKNKKS